MVIHLSIGMLMYATCVQVASIIVNDRASATMDPSCAAVNVRCMSSMRTDSLLSNIMFLRFWWQA